MRSDIGSVPDLKIILCWEGWQKSGVSCWTKKGQILMYDSYWFTSGKASDTKSIAIALHSVCWSLLVCRCDRGAVEM